MSPTISPHTSVPPSAETELVRQLKAHDTNAMSEFYQRYASALYGVIHRIVKDTDEADDVLQETLIKIWQSVQNYDTSKGRLFTWSVNISRNLAINNIRTRNRHAHDNHILFNDPYTQDSTKLSPINESDVIILNCQPLNEQLDNLANMADRVESSEFKRGFRDSVVARAKAANSFITYRDKEGKLVEEWPATGRIEALGE